MEPIPESFDLRVNVTTSHIIAGERSNCAKCPVALAVREAIESKFGRREEKIQPYVTPITAYVTVRDQYRVGDWSGPLPEAVENWINAFDELPQNAGTYTPFSFVLKMGAY